MAQHTHTNKNTHKMAQTKQPRNKIHKLKLGNLHKTLKYQHNGTKHTTTQENTHRTHNLTRKYTQNGSKHIPTLKHTTWYKTHNPETKYKQLRIGNTHKTAQNKQPNKEIHTKQLKTHNTSRKYTGNGSIHTSQQKYTQNCSKYTTQH